MRYLHQILIQINILINVSLSNSLILKNWKYFTHDWELLIDMSVSTVTVTDVGVGNAEAK